MFQLVNGINGSGCTAAIEICMLINIGQHDAYMWCVSLQIHNNLQQAAATCTLDQKPI